MLVALLPRSSGMTPMNRLILLGGSAGGLDAALTVVAQLDADLPAAVFVVLHLGDGPGQALLDKFAAAGPFPAAFAADGDPVEPGRIYVAPPDHHTLLPAHRIRLSRGPRVNRARPAIDLAFRSAAVAYREKAIGVVLSGMLDDGAAGLLAVTRCGGRAIVQDPDEAPHAGMPESALASVQSARRLPTASIGMLLNQLARTPVLTEATVPPAIALENRFDMNGTDDLAEMDNLGGVQRPALGGPSGRAPPVPLPRGPQPDRAHAAGYTGRRDRAEPVDRAAHAGGESPHAGAARPLGARSRPGGLRRFVREQSRRDAGARGTAPRRAEPAGDARAPYRPHGLSLSDPARRPAVRPCTHWIAGACTLLLCRNAGGFAAGGSRFETMTCSCYVQSRRHAHRSHYVQRSWHSRVSDPTARF